MRTFTVLLLILAMHTGIMAQITEPVRESGQLLVQLKNANDQQLIPLIESDFSQTGLKAEKKLSPRMNIWLLRFDESIVDADRLLSEIRNHPAVGLAQFNHIVTQREVIPDDPSFSSLWALKNTGQMSGTPGADIKATYAWDITTSGETLAGDTIVIAMVDGGIDLGHSDLRLWKNRLEIPFNGIDDDENGYIDDYNGWNAYNNNAYITQNDHGTHVAGIASAKGNNSLGVTGVAYNTYLMPVSGSGSNEAVAVISYDYIYTMRKIYDESNGEAGAFVVVTNSSFGIDGGNPVNYPLWGAIYDSLGSVGILNVASTANRAWDVDVYGDIPTSMTNESIVAVTNSTNTDGLNPQAAWGATSIDLAAPGTNINSTRLGNTYGYKSGTSMSSPHVSGSIALMYAAADAATLDLYRNDPVLVSQKFKRYLIASVDTIQALVGNTVSGGRLNLQRALEMVQNPPVILADPPVLNLLTAPETITALELQLTSENTVNNPFNVSIPDSAEWLSIDTTAGVMRGSNPETITVTFNPNGLADDTYLSTIRVTDYFLNVLDIPVEMKVRVGVNTSRIRVDSRPLHVYPNPAGQLVNVQFSLEAASRVEIQIIEPGGRIAGNVVNGTYGAGTHTISYNNSLKPGFYVVKLTTPDFTGVAKLAVE